ncbi:MAG TPA: carboxypeptidase regulatory-like domain-containing protein [Longimicrobiales bacterium]|nr:carboxypeptidase regulatory-like domain-containing protein [Longimicrobiales bacterium]
MDTTSKLRTVLRRLTVAAAGAVLAVAAGGPVSAQYNSVEGVIRGVVLDERTGQGIADVVVEVLDHVERIQRSAVTDEEGRFTLLRVRPGPFWLRASHIAYSRTKTPMWRIGSGEVLDVSIRLHPEVVLLAPLEITARAQSASPVLARFYERLNRRMGGTLFTREDIEARNPPRVTDLLAGVTGVNLQSSANQSFRIVTMARALPGMGGGPNGCPVQIYVDGILATRGGPVSPDELLAPGSLEGVEVYRGIGTVPAEFLTPEARCGVIAFWTRRGG